MSDVLVGDQCPLYWDDITPGWSWRFGNYPVTSNEIVEFAHRYDPMPMHVDPNLAKATPLGQFCASGVHTFAMTQRLLCDNLFLRTQLVAGGRTCSFIMRRPVVPGDRLSVRATVTNKTPHNRRKTVGWLDFAINTLRADGETVLEFESRILFERR